MKTKKYPNAAAARRAIRERAQVEDYDLAAAGDLDLDFDEDEDDGSAFD